MLLLLTLKQIIDNAIVAEGVDDIFELVGLDKPNVGLLSPEFLEEVGNMKEKNQAVDLLERLLRDEVKARMKTYVVSEKKYSERILETLRKYHNRAIETAQVIEELIQMAKDMAADAELAANSGLSTDELAFYRALIQNKSAVKELGDNNLKELATYVTEQLRKSTTVDWQVRDSVRAKLRNLVRRALRRWKYPPDGAAEAVVTEISTELLSRVSMVPGITLRGTVVGRSGSTGFWLSPRGDYSWT